jgi:two-component system sensor kinase ParS
MRDDLRELEDLVSELLTYARLEHPQIELVTEPVDTQNWLASAVGALALEAEANGIECHIAAGTVANIDIEPRFMARALLNLLRNAIYYAQHRVELNVQLFPDGAYQLWVDDDGPGIPAIDRLRIFEPFTRLDESRNRATGGFGLGLAIVRRIAEWHRGTVMVVDSPLGGARFVIRWPSKMDR